MNQQMLRRLSSSLTVGRVRVDAVRRESGLVMLRPATLQDTGRVAVGSVVKANHSDTEVVCLFKMKDAIFGTLRDPTASIEEGTVLEKTGELMLPNSDKKVFDDPPRDMDRTPITTTFHVGIAAMDLMLPIGQGQSLIFFERSGNQTHLFDLISSSLPASARVFFPATLPESATHADRVLATLTACAEAERFRDANSSIPAILSVRDFSPHFHLWQEGIEMMGRPELDRTDLRHFYSGFVQRAARIKSTENSLTLLLRMPPSGMEQEMDTSVYDLSDIENEAKQGIRPVEDFERLVMLRMRIPGMELTGERLRKLRIAPPSQRDAAVVQQNQEELMSIVDGHVFSSPDFVFDPKTSLTRIVTGTWHDTDLRRTLTKSVAGGMRLEISDLYDTNQAKAKVRLEAMKRAMKHPSQASSLRFQCALAFAVKAGMYDTTQSAAMFDFDEIEKLDLDQPYDDQLDLLRKCVGWNHGV